jgi:hypothetical protein
MISVEVFLIVLVIWGLLIVAVVDGQAVDPVQLVLVPMRGASK